MERPRKSLSYESVLEHLKAVQARADAGKLTGSLWQSKEGRVSVRLRTTALVQCWIRTNNKVANLASEIIGKWKFGTPEKYFNRKERKKAPWDKDAYVDYLNTKEVSIEADQAETLFVYVIEILIHRGIYRKMDQIAQSLAQCKSIEELTELALRPVKGPGSATLYPPDTFRPSFGPSFMTDMRMPAPDLIQPLADEALKHLVNPAGRRMVLIESLPHTGKKAVLNLLLRGQEPGYIVMTDNRRLPILALSMRDHTPGEFVDRVYHFYAAAARQTELGLSDSVRIDRIAQLSRQYAGCIFLADTEPFERDEVVRMLQGNVGAVLDALLKSDPATRLVLTVTPGVARASQESWRDCIVHTVCMDAQLPISWIRGLPDFLKSLDSHFRADGVCWQLALALNNLPARGPANPTFNARFKATLQGTDPAQELARLIMAERLSEEDQAYVGLIASSYDGLRPSVLRRLWRALKSSQDGAHLEGDALKVPFYLLQALVQERAAPMPHREFRAGDDPEEPLYCVDEGWRRFFLKAWFEVNGRSARFGMWLIAREAAGQARHLRIDNAGVQSRAARGRDVQAIHALIASLDPANTIAPHGSTEHFTEGYVLPPLDRTSAAPNPQCVLRFAYLQLYLADLEGGSFQLLTIYEDARIRLGILLAFFEPDKPWLPLERRTLSEEWRGYSHLTRALSPEERIALLTNVALAAQRVQRFDVVARAARLGEKLADELAEQEQPLRLEAAPNLMRLLRSEIEVGLLLGGNPDELLGLKPSTPNGFTLATVTRRVHDVLEKWFTRPQGGDAGLLISKGKLLARLGEIEHVAGPGMRNARLAFEAALRLEQDVLAIEPHASIARPVFGGRGSRAALRRLLDAARRRRRHVRNAMFIFIDELYLPETVPVPADTGAMVTVRALLDENTRRLTKGRTAEALTIRIDAARVAAAEYDLAYALRLLDDAASARLGADPNIELLLELAAVRLRLTVEAAVVCLAINARPGPLLTRNVVPDLGRYIGLDEQTPALDVAWVLTQRAEERLDTLERVARRVPVRDHPYEIYARYHRGIWFALCSRFSAERNEHLTEALGHLEAAWGLMQERGYCMHAHECRSLLDAIRIARETPAGGPPRPGSSSIPPPGPDRNGP